MVKPRRIADFKPTFTNLAQTSHYQLIFGGLPLGVRQHLNVRGVDYRFMTETTGLLCSSAVIPGSTLADTKVIGNYQGVIENMTHARIFPDIALEFYVDSEYKIMKFFEHYIEFVAGGSREDQSQEDYYHQMEYPSDYKMVTGWQDIGQSWMCNQSEPHRDSDWVRVRSPLLIPPNSNTTRLQNSAASKSSHTCHF